MSKPRSQAEEDPALAFLQTLWALDHRLQSHSKRMRSITGVTGPQRLVIRMISAQPEIGPSDLARVLHFHKSTISVILRSLERAKLVKRTPNPKDARSIRLALTPRGDAIAKIRHGTVEAVVRSVMAKLSASEIRTARKVLDTLARAFT